MAHTSPLLNTSFVDDIAATVRTNAIDNSENFDSLLAKIDKHGVHEVYDALVILKRNVESQLSAERSRDLKKRNEFNHLDDSTAKWQEYLAQRADWRAKVTKFLTSIEMHLSVVKSYKRSLTQESVAKTLYSQLVGENN